ncbi:MAG: hypothetical protein QXY30_04235 [Candidatus Bathyarchaeia archaeon]
MTADIHNYAGRLQRAKERLSQLKKSGLLDNLSALGLSTGRTAKYANLPYKELSFDPAGADRRVVEHYIILDK